MSAWDNLDKDSSPKGEGEQVEQVTEVDVAGVDDDSYLAYEEVDELIEAEQQEPAPKKKNMKPVLIGAGVLALGLLGGMGYMVNAMLSAGKSGGSDVMVEQPSGGLPEDGAELAGASSASEPVDMFTDAAPSSPDVAASDASLAASSADQAASSEPSVAAAMPASDVPLASSGPAGSVTSAPAVVAAADPALSGKVGQLQDKVDALANDVDEIKRRLAQSPSVSSNVSNDKPRHKVASQKRVVHASKKRAKGDVKVAQGDKKVTAKDVSAPRGDSDSVSGLSLRAVNPPSGPDMQAWVMDGDKITVVTKGSVIRGAKVTLIESDRVVTTAGVIR